jgi:hypothetical protein
VVCPSVPVVGGIVNSHGTAPMPLILATIAAMFAWNVASGATPPMSLRPARSVTRVGV